MKKCIILSVICAFFITFAAAAYSKEVQSGIASDIVRLHILANSDTPEDQALKIKVRDRILKEGKKLFVNCQSKAGCDKVLNENLPYLLAAAEDEILKSGYTYSAKISRGDYFFPMKTYKNFSLPAGEYDAVRIEIGKGEGKNWWCVMFPPLCFVDAAMDDGITKILSEEELDVISPAGSVNIKFKIVDFFQNSIHSVKTALKR